MPPSRAHDGSRRGHRAALIGITAVLAALLPASTVSAVAASTGYTASLIRAATEGTWTAVDSATDTIYVGAEATLTVINGATRSVTTTVSLGGFVEGVAVDATTDKVYVADTEVTGTSTSGVYVIDGATNTVAATISEPAGVHVGGIAVDSMTDTIYVTNPSEADVTVIDGATNAITTTVRTGTATRPVSAAVDESTDVVWVADVAGTVIAINGATDTVSNVVGQPGGEPVSVAVNEATDTVYAADFRNAAVAVIDGKTATFTTFVPVGTFPRGVAVDQRTGVVYATTNIGPLGTTFVIDGDKVTNTIARGGLSVAIDQSTDTVYEDAVRTGGVWVITASAANALSPVITSAASAFFDAGIAGKYAVVVSALPLASSTETGAMPAGVTLSASGVVTGTPAADSGGLYPIAITASNGVAPDYAQQFNLTVFQAPAITSRASTTFAAGKSRRFQVSANGYPAPTYTEVGALPGGLSFSSAGLLTGNPAAGSGGLYPITITARNGISPSASQAFKLTVDEAPAFTSARSATFKAGHWRRFTFRTTGFPAATLSERGRLPVGVRFRAGHNGTAVLAGRATRADRGKTFRITITARNGIGAAVHENFRLKVS